MKNIGILLLIFASHLGTGQPMIKTCDCTEMQLGERLKYKIKYGWFKVGEAVIQTDTTLHYLEGEPHYYVKFNLETGGILKIFANLDLRFDSYVNARTFRPHKSTRFTRNGKKENNQWDTFSYRDSIYVETYRENRDKAKNHSYEETGTAFLDALSTYLYVRAQKLDMQSEEKMRLYISDRTYDFKIQPHAKLTKKKGDKTYEMKFPPIKQFPRKKTSYAVFSNKRNIPLEIKLATNDGNFFLILDD